MIATEHFSEPTKIISLTVRELECLQLLAGGFNYEGISKQLSISGSTVAMHVTNARRKLKATTREQAVALAMRAGLLK